VTSAGTLRSGLRRANTSLGRPGTTSAYSSSRRSPRLSSMAAARTLRANGDCGAKNSFMPTTFAA
jgi:hypothetical protein